MPELKLQQSRLDGRYDIVECLGRGSYAEIYVAYDKAAADGAPRTVVIKALNTYLQETPDAELERTLVSNFQNEAVALDRVRHPNIISRLGHGTAIDLSGCTFHYLVLEYLPGGDMMALSRDHPLPMQEALYYLEQVCSGLAHAHKCGVIHRDIKPQNLLLSADRKIVKIADFGVARFEASEGAITRVGTNIYSAPEHNPLVQTGRLDTGSLGSSQHPLTPAADVYSLAKTTYSLLAGASPRRFAQHAISELPTSLANQYWSSAVLRVLEKATQTRPQHRYQSVEEFWDQLADATRLPVDTLGDEVPEPRRRASEELEIEPQEFTEVPAQARFVPLVAAAPEDLRSIKRPRIVVPVNVLDQPEAQANLQKRTAREIVESLPDQSRNGRRALQAARRPETRTRKLIVATALIIAFSGMLWATHRYVTSHWNSISDIPRIGEILVVGREGVTTTDVNLRPDASVLNPPIGLAEYGSRVKILNINSNWYEVQVMEHGRTKTDPFSSDRGWINKRFVKFD
jgi:serine/threonine protein kinase